MTTIGTPYAPSLNTSKMVNRMPNMMMPSRKTFLTQNLRPGLSTVGIGTMAPMIRPSRMPSITAEIGVLSKPSRVMPMNLLNQMLSQASKAATSKPGSNEGTSLTGMPSRFFSQALIFRGRAVFLVLTTMTS